MFTHNFKSLILLILTLVIGYIFIVILPAYINKNKSELVSLISVLLFVLVYVPFGTIFSMFVSLRF